MMLTVCATDVCEGAFLALRVDGRVCWWGFANLGGFDSFCWSCVRTIIRINE